MNEPTTAQPLGDDEITERMYVPSMPPRTIIIPHGRDRAITERTVESPFIERWQFIRTVQMLAIGGIITLMWNQSWVQSVMMYSAIALLVLVGKKV